VGPRTSLDTEARGKILLPLPGIEKLTGQYLKLKHGRFLPTLSNSVSMNHPMI